MTIVDYLKSFNRKERFLLLHKALGVDGQSFILGDTFRIELGHLLKVVIPKDAFVAMDYHLDWLQMVVYLTANQAPDWPIRNDNLVDGNQEDIDLLVAFEDCRSTYLILIEAKGVTAWSSSQMKSKTERIKRIFHNVGSWADRVIPRFLIMSPTRPQRIEQEDWWPEWMAPGGRLRWLPLPLPEGLVKPTRCDKTGSADRTGEFIRLELVSPVQVTTVRTALP